MTKSYRIRIQGLLDPAWSEHFEGLTISPEDNETTLLVGEVCDDAQLHAILRALLSLNLSILFLEQIAADK